MQILERKWLGAGQVAVLSGKYQVVFIPTGKAGRLHKVSIKQNGGAGVAFVADVFDSVAAAGAVGSFSTPYTPVSPTAYRIIPQLSASSGAEAAYRDSNGQPFHNYDNTNFSDTQYGLYLALAPTGAGGTTNWDVAITVTDSIG